MAEHNSTISYKFKIGERDFEYTESFSSYKLNEFFQFASKNNFINAIFQNEKFKEASTKEFYSDLDVSDAFDFISQFNLLYCKYKEYDEQKISNLYKVTEKIREQIYLEKFHISLLNNYENLDTIESEIPVEYQQSFNDFFISLISTFEENNLSFNNLVTRINNYKYPKDFEPTLKKINEIINRIMNDSSIKNWEIYRSIDTELFKYIKTKPVLLNKVTYAKKVLNHLTTTKSYLNKYLAGICGTASIPQKETNSYEYLLEKIQSKIIQNSTVLGITYGQNNVISQILNSRTRKNLFDVSNTNNPVCIAFLIDPIQNYYSFNGIDNVKIKFSELKDKFDVILNGENFKYAQLHDDTRSFYLEKGNKKNDGKLWEDKNIVPPPDNYITYSTHTGDDKLFTCCERKILTRFGYKDNHKYHFLIAMSPCLNCQRAFNYAVFDNNADFNIKYLDQTGNFIEWKTMNYDELVSDYYFK